MIKNNIEECVNELINIFAHSNIDVLDTNQNYFKLCDKYKEFSWFNAKRKKIERIKQFLEKSVGQRSSPKEQVVEALILLNKLMGKPNNEEEVNIGYSLIIEGYSIQWNPSQLEHFKKYYSALRNNYDYFLSFTDRNPTPQYNNFINENYRFLIKRLLGGHKEFKEANKKKNLLARGINRYIESATAGKYKCFFYPQKEGDSQEVEKKLRCACENCFVFIQLIQNIMFTCSSKTNYCHLEYHHAHNCSAGKEGFIFLLAEKSHQCLEDFCNDVYVDYDNWYKDVLSRDPTLLEPIEQYSASHISKQLDTINRNVVEKIDKIKWELIKNVPD